MIETAVNVVKSTVPTPYSVLRIARPTMTAPTKPRPSPTNARTIPSRKIILSTNVAETSVTVEGVTGVVDTGLARQVQRNTETMHAYAAEMECELGDFAEYFEIRRAITEREKAQARQSAPFSPARVIHAFLPRLSSHSPQTESRCEMKTLISSFSGFDAPDILDPLAPEQAPPSTACRLA